MRAFAAILICIVLAAFIEAATISFWIANNFMSLGGSGSALPTPNLDGTLIVMLSGFFGGLFGLFCAVAAYLVLRNDYVSRFNVGKFIFLPFIFGLIHSALMASLEYSNAVYGRETSALSGFQQKIILTTAVIEFITGVLIGLSSVLIMSFILGGSRTGSDQPT